MKINILLGKTGYGFAVFIFLVVMTTGLNLGAQPVIDPLASAVAKSIGYSMSRQYEAAKSITHVDCSSIQHRLTGMIDQGFYLSGVVITHYEVTGKKGSLQGMMIHQDPYEREIYSGFSAGFQGLRTAQVIDVDIEPGKNLKPVIQLYIVPAEKVSMENLENATFTQALEQVSMNARKLDGTSPGDSQPQDYLAVAFRMNRQTPAYQINLVMDSKPGTLSGRKTGRLLDKNGWLIAVISDKFSCDSGQEWFFNIIPGETAGKQQIAGVYSSHSLARRIQQALMLRGYKPGLVDGRPGMKTISAVKMFQKDIGVLPDGKLSASLLRLLISPKIPPAGILIQRHLAQLGYDIGTIDGVIGPNSVVAIRAFQNDRNLLADGLVTADLLCRTSDAFILSNPSGLEQETTGKVDLKSAIIRKENRFEDRMLPNMAKQ